MQITSDFFGQILLPPLGGLVWLALSWSWCRTVRAGKPLTPVQKRMMAFGFLFVVGMVYLMAWNSQLAIALGFPGRLVWVPLTIVWGVVLGVFAWQKYRREQASSGAPAKLDRPVFIEGLARAGLLVAMIGAVIEWVFVVEKEGHLWIALLWTAGCVAMVVLAKRDRRGAVLLALRLLVLLAIIGAISRPSVAAGVVVAAIAITLFLTQKLWTSHSVGPPPGPVRS